MQKMDRNIFAMQKGAKKDADISKLMADAHKFIFSFFSGP